MSCWCGYLSGATFRLFAYGSADATASQNPIISSLILIQNGFTFLVLAVLEKRPLNGCLLIYFLEIHVRVVCDKPAEKE